MNNEKLSFSEKMAKNYVNLELRLRDCKWDTKEYKIPYPKALKNEFVIIGALVIATIFFIPMAVFALIACILALWTTLFNKQMKAKNEQFKAIKAYKLSDFNKCIEHCNKSLNAMYFVQVSELKQDAQQCIDSGITAKQITNENMEAIKNGEKLNIEDLGEFKNRAN